MHLAYHFQRLARRHPRRAAVVEHGRTWSYGELARRIGLSFETHFRRATTCRRHLDFTECET